MTQKNVVLAGGGTGGHFFAAIAIAEELHDRGYKVDVITDKRCTKYFGVVSTPFKIHVMDINRPVIKWNMWKTAKSIVDFVFAILSHYRLLKNLSPDAVVSCGGYSSFGVVVSAFLQRAKVLLHEQNAVVGRANNLLARLADVLFLSFAYTINLPAIPSHRIILSGNPVRNHFADNEAKDFYSTPFTLLVLGGSQGAEIFDKTLPQTMRIVRQSDSKTPIRIIQQVRQRNLLELKEYYQKLNIVAEVEYFFYDIHDKYVEAHLAICRAGAITISEITQTATPAIFIPYPYATANHQLYNALNLANGDAAWIIKQVDLTAQVLATRILSLMNDRPLLQETSMKLSTHRQDSRKIIADTLDSMLKK